MIKNGKNHVCLSREHLPFAHGGVPVSGYGKEGGQGRGNFLRFVRRVRGRNLGRERKSRLSARQSAFELFGHFLRGKAGRTASGFVCMDESNLRGAKRILGAAGAGKCRKLLSFAGEDGDVSDPWYTRDFQKAYEDIRRGLEGILRSV